MIKLGAGRNQPEYKVGQHPVLRIAITNTGPVACFRDVDAALQEVLVLSGDGQARVWSSNDCWPWGGKDVRLLKPNEEVFNDVTWFGNTSTPGCNEKRVTVGAGAYQVVPKLGPLQGPGQPFAIVP
ncbi:hypothetical protein D5S17_12960 [Pseudonocardiaceae bacterium YIM PH 21723]|nr:hypothetical protein D5S17_12960 [Pseudonocardiaceae bacterium YIM PH 21723]